MIIEIQLGSNIEKVETFQKIRQRFKIENSTGDAQANEKSIAVKRFIGIRVKI